MLNKKVHIMALSEEETLGANLLNVLKINLQSNPAEALIVLKKIKHTLIGHDEAKQFQVEKGLIPVLVQILQNEQNDSEFRLEAVISLGSIAFGNCLPAIKEF